MAGFSKSMDNRLLVLGAVASATPRARSNTMPLLRQSIPRTKAIDLVVDALKEKYKAATVERKRAAIILKGLETTYSWIKMDENAVEITALGWSELGGAQAQTPAPQAPTPQPPSPAPAVLEALVDTVTSAEYVKKVKQLVELEHLMAEALKEKAILLEWLSQHPNGH